MINREGWVCPKCGRVYNPITVSECQKCNNFPEKVASPLDGPRVVSVKKVLDRTREENQFDNDD